MTNDQVAAIAVDKALIERLGGAAKVAALLGYDKAKGGVQRVFNWQTRGIPSSVKLARPDLFLPDFAHSETEPGTAQEAS